ncbi:hypothetical protein IAT38_002218 [Cryptococcus sp. DSM 104549]
MTPKLRVLLSDSSGKPTTPCPVNSPSPTPIRTPGFEGDLWVFVKDYAGDEKRGEGKEYFGEEGRGGMTYGIVVKGRFLKDLTADDVVFGNVFQKPIRDSLPWGTSVATKFMYFIDPTLELDIYADKPWALSPALATMNLLSLSTAQESGEDGAKPVVKEGALELLRSNGASKVPETSGLNEKSEIAARRKWLGVKENRESVKLSKDVLVGMEFANGLLDFNTLSASLPPPFSLHIPLLKYWDGQPVTYVCQRRPAAGGKASPVGEEVFWSVAFEIVDEEAKAALEKRGGAVAGKTEREEEEESQGGEKGEERGKAKVEEKKEEVSDDVD